MYITVPVNPVTITPPGDNNVVDIIGGETHICTCTTYSCRPAAWILWYNYFFIFITVPVTTMTITPAGDHNVVDIIEGRTQTFTCTTDSCRPDTWIQWYN
jgi:hypothetical protein